MGEEKFFYFGPMFRRERPQKGRWRQFYQIGAEAFGLFEPTIDVEAISMLYQFLTNLGLKDFCFQLNSLGQPDERANFSQGLRTFFADKTEKLCGDCARRLERNVLRILDCKKESCIELVKKAPTTLEFLESESKNHFLEVQKGLEQLSVPFVFSPLLVRGLDYYTRTVFEVTSESGLGSQNAIAAGGRYDKLVENVGGKPTPAFGFSAGMGRIVLLMEEKGLLKKKQGPDIALVSADEQGRDFVFGFADKLRKLGLSILVEHQKKSVKAQMRKANKHNSVAVMVIGEKEIVTNKAKLQMLSKVANSSIELDAGKIVNTFGFLKN